MILRAEKPAGIALPPFRSGNAFYTGARNSHDSPWAKPLRLSRQTGDTAPLAAHAKRPKAHQMDPPQSQATTLVDS